MLHFYPYLRGAFNYKCADDPWEAGKAPYSPGHDAGGDQFKAEEWWQRDNHEQLMQRLAEHLRQIEEHVGKGV